jgi:hypothetical protein
MAKPTKLPEWATGATGIAETVEPSAGKKADGWADAELPPHETFNWLHKTTYDWTAWVDEQLREEEQLIVDVMAGFPSAEGGAGTPALMWNSSLGVVNVFAANGGDAWDFALPMQAGNHIERIDFYYKRDAGDTGSMTFALVSLVNGAPAVVASDSIGTGTAATTFVLPVDAALAADKMYRLRVTFGRNGDVVIGAVVRYRRA